VARAVRAGVKLGGGEFGINHQRQPKSQLGDMTRPIHHVHAIKTLADDALLAVKSAFFRSS